MAVLEGVNECTFYYKRINFMAVIGRLIQTFMAQYNDYYTSWCFLADYIQISRLS